jgi:hypothetical protein
MWWISVMVVVSVVVSVGELLAVCGLIAGQGRGDR